MIKLSNKMKCFGAFLALIMLLMPSSCGISPSVSCDIGGFSEVIQAKDDEYVKEVAIITASGLSDIISGQGSIKKSFHSNPSNAGSAEVGFDIKNAESYSYSYYIDEYYTQVSDTLDVINADKIIAYASARNSRGDIASASTKISDENKEASLYGYSSLASSGLFEWEGNSGTNAWASQSFVSASGDKIQTDEQAINVEGHKASSSITVNEGSLEYYDGGAAAAANRYLLDGIEWRLNNYVVAFHDVQLSAAKAKIDEQATDAEGDTASSSIITNEGYYDPILGCYGHYYGGAGAGWHQFDRGDWSQEGQSVTTYHGIDGLTAAKIEIDDQVANIEGDTASTGMVINEGSMGSFYSTTSAGLSQNDDWENRQRIASIQHESYGLSAVKIKVNSEATNAEGDTANSGTIIENGYVDWIKGAPQAGWLWDESSGEWRGASAGQDMFFASNAKLDLTAQAVNVEGVKEEKSLKIKDSPPYTEYNIVAEVLFGVPSASCTQI